MKKVKLRDIRMGEVFSRVNRTEGFSYIKTGGVVSSASGDLPVCYCLDSGNEYPWMADEEVYLQYSKEDTVEDKKYYKGFRVVDGVLKSLVDWGGCKVEFTDDYAPEVLTYKEGQITYAPEGTQGIFFEETLQSAKDLTNSNGGHCHKVIHEVTPLGEQGIGWNHRPICPAVLVGKYVYGFSEPTIQEPEPVWVDVTDECTVEATRVEDELGVRIHHDSYVVARLCLGNREHEMVGGIGNWEYELRTTNGSWFKVFRRHK